MLRYEAERVTHLQSKALLLLRSLQMSLQMQGYAYVELKLRQNFPYHLKKNLYF
jgi:hypothetical protein